MKKTLTILALILSLAPTTRAAEAPLLDFSSFFTKARLGYSVDQHLTRSTVLYSAVQRFHDSMGTELANFNAGYDATSKHPVFQLGIRADNLIPKLWGGAWGATHVTTAALPATEFGPYVSAWPKVVNGKVKADFFYGLALAVGFSK